MRRRRQPLSAYRAVAQGLSGVAAVQPRVARTFIVLALASTAFGSAPSYHNQRPDRGHNALEYTYVQFAIRLAWLSDSSDRFHPSPDTLPAAVALCEKIDPEALDLSVAFGGFESWSYRYLRSHCFRQIAAAARMPELCDRVRVLDSRPPTGFLGRENPVTPACLADAKLGRRTGWAEFGNEMILLLLGYTPEEIAAGAGGRTLEEDGAYEFLSFLLMGRVSDLEQEEHDRRRDAFVQRLLRLPDFSQGDQAALRQLDALVPGWAVRANTSRLAEALRCAIERLPPGRALSTACLDRL